MKFCDVQVVFATASPRRVELAQNIKYVNGCNGVRIVPVFMPTDAHEVTLVGAQHTASRNALIKAQAAAERTELPVIAFDTVVGIGDEVLGKPRDAADAERMFRLLCGNTHEVVTAVCLITGGKNRKIVQDFERTLVSFGAYENRIVDDYIQSGAPFDKAGGYNVADSALAPIITGVSGEYDNVVGLPVKLTEKLIEENVIYGEVGNCH